MNKRIKSALIKTAATAAALCIAAIPVSASRTPGVSLGGEKYTGAVKLVNGTAYVKLREFANLHGAGVTWDEESNLAGAFTSDVAVLATKNASYITANGRYLWCSDGAFIEDGRMYVPLRVIGAAFGYDTYWDADSFTASLTKSRDAIEHGDSYYSGEDLYWLSRIISAEAEGEPMSGKLAVGAVVLNRVKSSEFPSSVRQVIFDRENGVQFTPVSNGTVYKTPDQDSVIAAKLCLEGLSVDGSILFFINTDIAESLWITKNRKYVMTIGGHDFYS